MIHSDLIREIMFALTGAVFVAFALFAAVAPRRFATLLDYELRTRNAHSEFSAIYFGVFLAQATLAGLAFNRVQDATIGDLLVVFLLAQPLGRLLAALKYGLPTGVMRLMFAAEFSGGLALLAVRPSAY